MTGAELKDLRARSGLLQTEVAELIGIRPETLSRVENGKQTFPKSKLTAALIDALNGAVARHGRRLAPKLRTIDSFSGRLRFILGASA